MPTIELHAIPSWGILGSALRVAWSIASRLWLVVRARCGPELAVSQASDLRPKDGEMVQ